MFGLGVPFAVAGLAIQRATTAFGFVSRHYREVRLGGGMLVIIGSPR
jgi:cytochrome c biogenesis protein CcdA